jgi:hypothetical protein
MLLVEAGSDGSSIKGRCLCQDRDVQLRGQIWMKDATVMNEVAREEMGTRRN